MKITFEQKCKLSSQFYFNIVHSLGMSDRNKNDQMKVQLISFKPEDEEETKDE